MNGGNENFPGNKFIFEIINIEEKFLHKNFKFKFFNQGNTEGPFDSWVIDYIYINNNFLCTKKYTNKYFYNVINDISLLSFNLCKIYFKRKT